jgi:Spy/CpxP family protein refolding chaperone
VPSVAGGQAKAFQDSVAVRRNRIPPLDRRVALLAKELDLDAAQKIKVKAVLEGQRQQVARVWSDGAIPSAERIGRTQAIGDHTADQIRALLTEEQRKKYIQARQRDVAVGTPGSDTQSWMQTGKQPKAAP